MAFMVKILFYLIRCLPVRLAGAIGAGLGRAAYLIDGRHRQIAMRNLHRLYPQKSMAWKQRISRESFAELGRTTFEMPHVFLRSKQFLTSRIEFVGLEEINKAAAAGHGTVFTACHLSNWEIGALSISLVNAPGDQMYRAVRQPPLDAFLKQCRERFGNRLHERRENMRWIPKTLKQGKSVSIMVDQHLSNGVPVPFMGHLARSTTLPATYARRNHSALFAGIVHRIGHQFRFRIEFKRITLPPQHADSEQDALAGTAALHEAYAQAIDQRPELWLWIHRRWLYLDEQEQA
ncbi:lauroyl acyltransferase [Mariprofundus sp. EBB-1]|uniref:lysophospholipid acyltransferase family protein n=1 Tax=Mariprofundus sp. EBB-1 TaxID=2650971 RepID=UPI000EF1DFA3|nr:lysophospholipid acyltransferase family protein [Mariprofundus sp. EBB-1]RLL50911.1 lauroyl acyltransferase [Mariprofundus sp. EBB-1]